MLRLGWFSTGRDKAARNLLSTVMQKKEEGFFDIDIPFVFSNWEQGEEPEDQDHSERERFFDLVRSYDIPLVACSWKRFEPRMRKERRAEWRLAYGRAMRSALSEYPFDVGVLAGYMLWMDDETCSTYDLINLHPALPSGPKGTWQEVIWQLIEKKADKQGAMFHLCTKEWDRGPALTYCSFDIRGAVYDSLWWDLDSRSGRMSMDAIKREIGESEPLFRQIRQDGEVREIPLLAYTIKLLADRTVKIENKELFQEGHRLDHAYDLTKEVDQVVKCGELRGNYDGF